MQRYRSDIYDMARLFYGGRVEFCAHGGAAGDSGGKGKGDGFVSAAGIAGIAGAGAAACKAGADVAACGDSADAVAGG
ncbi:MAG: hypothetical protein LBJ10_04500, partial [Clostridiales bacterium]|nr:hypothetical protein [Clostridiales bacterium]